MTAQSASQKIADHFEVLILGGRLSGWIAAKIMASHGLKVGLIHREADQGQEYKLLETPFGPQAEGLRILPAGAAQREGLSALSEALGLEIPLREASESLQTFDAGKPKSFLGFGDSAPESLPVLESYLASEYRFLEGSVLEAIYRTCSEGPTNLSPHEITSLTRSDAGWIVELDHQKSYLADRIFYAQSPSLLHKLLRSPGARPSKDLRSLSRWEPWSSLSLTLVHKPQAAAPFSPWLLMGSKLEPCIGVFESATEENQVSHWLSFLPHELAASEEFCAGAYREMKRQIKRAFPEGVLEPLWEKISVYPHSHGASIWPLGGQELDLGKDIYLMGPAFSTEAHPLWAELLSPLQATARALGTSVPEPRLSAENLQLI